MIGSSKSFMDLKLSLARIAASNSTVLLTGETGTGKELAAEFVHANSARRGRPFVCINCAAIPDTLLENELFGHARGAFTGADATCDGLLAAANGGTVFLDEVGDMSLSSQAKVLRVIEKKEVYRIGTTRPTLLDVRFVAATNQQLDAKAAQGQFRKDLFFRLGGVHVHLPALRERKEDLPLLLRHYCQEFGTSPKSPPVEFSERALGLLLRYEWPGNIRELKNLIESLSISEIGGPVEPEHLPLRFRGAEEPPAGPRANQEREMLICALSSSNGNKAAAARILNWSRMTLYRKLSKHRLHASPVADEECHTPVTPVTAA
jgi:DNA-binding NtrC family response regulator